MLDAAALKDPAAVPYRVYVWPYTEPKLMPPDGVLASTRNADVLNEIGELADWRISKLTETPVVGPPNASDPEEFIVIVDPYGVVKPNTLSRAVNTPAALNEAITVLPFLITSLPPSSKIEKLLVVTLETAPPSVMLPEEVTVPESVRPLAEPVPTTEVTVPVVLDVPAPMAVRKSAAFREDTVLSALKRRNVTALGLLIVNRLLPSVVAPKLVRAVAAVVAPEPPLATGSAPVTLVAKFTKVVDVVPVPPLAIGKVPVTLVARLTKVVDVEPVPPEEIGKAVLSASEVRNVI